MAHHHDDTPVGPFSKSDIGYRELAFLWIFGLGAGATIMLSFLYFSSMEEAPAPPFLLAMLAGIGITLLLNIGNMLFRWLLSLDD